MQRVTATQFTKTPGLYQDAAQTAPVIITKQSRDYSVLVSAAEYERLKRRDREVVLTGQLSDQDIQAIAGAPISEEARAFDHEYDASK